MVNASNTQDTRAPPSIPPRAWALMPKPITTAATMASGSPKSNILPTRARAVDTTGFDDAGIAEVFKENARALKGRTTQDYLVKALKAAMSGANSIVAQYAGLAALTGPQDPVDEMYAEYTKRRRLVLDALDAMDIPADVKKAFFEDNARRPDLSGALRASAARVASWAAAKRMPPAIRYWAGAWSRAPAPRPPRLPQSRCRRGSH